MKIINIDDDTLKKLTERIFKEQTYESTTHPFVENGSKKVFKLFKEGINVGNKTQKIILLNERLKNVDFVVTAENIIKHNGKVIGYTMPYIEGKIFESLVFNKEDSILILKDIAQKLKMLHSLGIVCGDIIGNIMVDSNKKVYFIDHDNFAIDNLPIDTRTILLMQYESITKTFDYHFDNYTLNLFTLTILTTIQTDYLKLQYSANPKYFNFKDHEINRIVKNTFSLKDTYKEDLIVNKINSKKDLKKVKAKLLF